MLKRSDKALDHFDKARDSWLMKIIRRVRKWPLVKYVRADWLSVGRIIIAIANIVLFALFIKLGSEKLIGWILSLTIIAYVSDLIDGSWARVEIEEGLKDKDSNFGALVDNIADKTVCIPSMFFVMYLQKVYWVPIMIIAIEIVFAVFRIIIGRKYKIQARANHFGQMKNWLHGFGICFILLELTIPGVAYIGYNMLKVAIVIGAISFLQHLYNLLPQVKALKRA